MTRTCYRTLAGPNTTSSIVDLPPNTQRLWVFPNSNTTASILYSPQGILQILSSKSTGYKILNCFIGNQILAFASHGIPVCPNHGSLRWLNTNPTSSMDLTFAFDSE